MCLRDKSRVGEGGATPWASWDAFQRACQRLSLSHRPPPPLLYLHPHPQRHIRSAPCKTKAAAAPKGTVPPPVFNPSYISSLPPPPPPPPSSKHFWLFCFAALPRVIAQDNNHARLFSLRSPGLCMHAGLVLPYDIQAFSIKYA